MSQIIVKQTKNVTLEVISSLMISIDMYERRRELVDLKDSSKQRQKERSGCSEECLECFANRVLGVADPFVRKLVFWMNSED